MWNLFKKLFSSFSQTQTGFIGQTGASLNPEDTRDIKLASFTQPRQALPKHITDISALPVQNQGDKPECVGQAEGFVVQYYIYKITGNIIPISRRFIYAVCKKLDMYPQQGTNPRVAGLVITKLYGAATTKTVPDDTSLSYEDFINVKLTGEVLNDAFQYKLPGFAQVGNIENEICQAIEDHGVITATLAVDESNWFVSFIKKLFQIDSFHRIIFYGHELIGGRRKIYFRNHWSKLWGDNGNGEFWFDEYQNYMYDLQVYTEIPSDLLKKAQSQNYIFSSLLQYGDSGIEVYKLQQRLQKDGYLKNIDIASLEPYFGDVTASALLQWQLEHKVGTPQTLKDLKGHYFGSATIKVINGQFPKEKNSIILWAQAIQQFEGWYPGSHSYRNCNPGNLRYSPLEIGNDGFSVFKDYKIGFQALVNLLTNAATGKSKVYYPEMTLLNFYNKYAPSNDGNYPHAYASFVARKIGVTVDTKIKELV